MQFIIRFTMLITLFISAPFSFKRLPRESVDIIFKLKSAVFDRSFEINFVFEVVWRVFSPSLSN